MELFSMHFARKAKKVHSEEISSVLLTFQDEC